MKELLENWNKFVIKESSLSRVWQHIQEHDCANISAERNVLADMSVCFRGESEETNSDERTHQLKAALLEKGYGVTKMIGSYIEDYQTDDATEVSETSLFVVNLDNDPNFFDFLAQMGQQYCQDSVLMIPQGGSGAYLHGTNNSDWPGLNKTEKVGDLQMGQESEFMSKVKGRPYTFKINENLEAYSKLSGNASLDGQLSLLPRGP